MSTRLLNLRAKPTPLAARLTGLLLPSRLGVNSRLPEAGRDATSSSASISGADRVSSGAMLNLSDADKEVAGEADANCQIVFC